jgi:hypothetical protein
LPKEDGIQVTKDCASMRYPIAELISFVDSEVLIDDGIEGDEPWAN